MQGLVSTSFSSFSPDRSGVFSLFNDADHFTASIKVPKICNLNFEVDGIPMNAANISAESGEARDTLVLWATLGYLPFSITSRDKRQSLIRILEAARQLPDVQVGVSRDMKIIIKGEYKILTPPTPNYIFEPVILFIQQARPFIRLIAEYL